MDPKEVLRMVSRKLPDNSVQDVKTWLEFIIDALDDGELDLACDELLVLSKRIFNAHYMDGYHRMLRKAAGR